MFDVGFSELVLVFVIGLLILGPERLPKVAAQVGRWVGRARRMANQLRYQLEREIALEEINRVQRPAPKPASSEAAAKPEGASVEPSAPGGPARGQDSASAGVAAESDAPPLGQPVEGTPPPGPAAEHAAPAAAGNGRASPPVEAGASERAAEASPTEAPTGSEAEEPRTVERVGSP